MATVLQSLAACIAGTSSTSDGAAEAARRSIADLTTSALAGTATLGGRSAQLAANSIFGSGSAPVWFSGKSLTIAGAAFANSAIACMLDLDDGHRAAAGHPGAAIIPAVLAEAASFPYPLPRLLDAIAIGYEVGVRLSRSRDFVRLDSTATGRWSATATTAALGWLRGVPEAVLSAALGISASHAPNLLRAGVRAEAGHVKEGIPWATACGVAALDLAQRGHTGSVEGYDDPVVNSRSAILDGWGEPWLIEGTYYKPYSCCRWAHAAIDGLVELIAEDPIAPDTIDGIELDLFSRALSLSNMLRPPSIETAQYSIPYVVGLVAVYGTSVLQPMRPDCLNDPRAIAVASRVVMRVDPAFDAMFPAATPTRITLTAGDQRRSREVLLPLGEPGNPMDWAALRQKQETVCSGLISDVALSSLWAATESMRGGDIGPLFSMLGSSVAAPHRATVVSDADGLPA